jgi:hypothetical protein
MVFPTWSVPRCYKQGTKLRLSQFCTGDCKERINARKAEESPLLVAVVRERLVRCKEGCEGRTYAREAQESPLLEAVARKRLVKTWQASRDLVRAMVIFELTILAVAL